MADVFISYSKVDRDAAEELAVDLRAASLSVWWDERLEAGDAFGATIDQEINAALAVVVIWSKASVTSNWVLAEAQHAFRQKKVVPVRLSDCDVEQIPKPFGVLHTEPIKERRAIVSSIEALRLRTNALSGVSSQFLGLASTQQFRSSGHISALGSVSGRDLIGSWRAYIKGFPDGPLADAVRDKLSRRINSGRLIDSRILSSPISVVAFSSDGQRIIGGCRNGSIVMGGAFHGAFEELTTKQRFAISSIAVSPDNRLFVSMDIYGGVMVWDLDRREMLYSAPAKALTRVFGGSKVQNVLFCASRSIACAGPRLSVWALDCSVGNDTHVFGIKRTAQIGRKWDVATLAVDGSHVLAAQGCDLMLWKIESKIKASPDKKYRMSSPIRSAGLSSDASLAFYVPVQNPDHIAALELADGGKVWSRKLPGSISGITTSPDGKYVAATLIDGPVHLLAQGGGNEATVLPLSAAKNRKLVFSQDSMLLASTSEEKRVETWDVTGLDSAT